MRTAEKTRVARSLLCLPLLGLIAAILWVSMPESQGQFQALDNNKNCSANGNKSCASTCLVNPDGTFGGAQCAHPYGNWSEGGCQAPWWPMPAYGCYGFLAWDCGEKQDCSPQRTMIGACATPNLCS